MSGDTIKLALIAAYPASSKNDWKRRSKVKGDETEHMFKNSKLGVTVRAIEHADGQVSLRFQGGETIPFGVPDVMVQYLSPIPNRKA